MSIILMFRKLWPFIKYPIYGTILNMGKRPQGGPEMRGTQEPMLGATTRLKPLVRPTSNAVVPGIHLTVVTDRCLEDGYVPIKWSIYTVRQYTPTRFYCKMGQRMWSHSMKYHRGGTSQKMQGHNSGVFSHGRKQRLWSFECHLDALGKRHIVQ